MSSLRLESAPPPHRGSGLERIRASRSWYAPSDEDLRHGLTEDNQPVGVGSVHGALWVACCSDCSTRQLLGEFGEDTAGAPAASLGRDGWGPVSWPAPLPSEL